MTRTAVLVTSLLLVALVFAIAPLAAGAQGGSIHVVQAGDTAYSIATRYCMSWQELSSLNAGSMSYPNQLYPGMQLQVINRCGGGSSGGSSGGSWHCGSGTYDRGPRLHAQGHVSRNVYIVARGDTAYSIAQRFGTSTYAIGQVNGINPWYIYAGQRLILPTYGGWCQPCTGYGGYYGYNCPPTNPGPPVYPIPITPVPTVPVVQPSIQITSPAPNTVLPPTFTVTGTAQGITTGLIVRAQTGGGMLLVDQPVVLSGGTAGTYATQITVNVAAPTAGFIVAFSMQTPPVAAVSVPVTFSPGGGPGGVQYKDYNSGACQVTVLSAQPYYGQPGGTQTGTFGVQATYWATRGAKLNNQLWFYVWPAPPVTAVWAPATSVTAPSPGCNW